MEIGIDLVEIARIQRAVNRWGERFLKRVFTEREIAIAQRRPASLAVRFAAKEATAKALGVGIGPVDWRELEVISEEKGKPMLLLHGRAQALAREMGLFRSTVSLSDTAEHAIAVVALW